MARMSNEAKAKSLAAKHSIRLDDEGEQIEIWAFDAQLHNDAGGHLDFIHLEDHPTKASQWKEVFESVREFIEDGVIDYPCSECGFIPTKI